MTAIAPATPHPSAMLRSFGPLYWLAGLPFLFRRLRMEDHSAERVRLAAARGPVVYALHTRSHVDWLALNRVLLDRRLPLPAFTSDFDGRRWAGLGEAWAARRSEASLEHSLEAGQSTAIFLARPWTPMDIFVPAPMSDSIRELLAVQARGGRAIQVVPVVVVWNRAPQATMNEVSRFILGTETAPGPLTKLWDLANNTAGGLVQCGNAIPLDGFLERYREDDPERRARILRTALRRHLYQEARVVRGPRARPYDEVANHVLGSAEVRDMMEKEVAATGQSPEKVRRKVIKTYRHIAARFSFSATRLAANVTRLIWNRIFSGVDVHDEDLDRIRAALRSGTPILVPCHRSHLDYLLISSVLFDRDIIVPHIVAGENLSFWPLGAIFRRCGAFFIKRSFVGDRIFPTVFARYLRELVRMEVPIEFFIEGGRSRTGKLLPPKTGVLSMLLDASAEAREGRGVHFVPIYVGYEQIAEEAAYARELGGARKEKENVGQVVRATRVLGQRYGKVYLRVAEPIAASEVISRDEWASTPKDRRDEILLDLGERILHRINTRAVALPTAIVALALLAHGRRGLRDDELRARVARMRALLRELGVAEGGGIADVDGIVDRALHRFLRGKQITSFDEGQQRVYRIVPEARVTLEYYKNAVMHAFAPLGYYAAAVRALRADTVDRAAVRRYFQMQQFLLRFEFILDPDLDVDEHERRAEAALVAYGALEVDGDRVLVADRARVGEIANLTANLVESYLLTMRVARAQAPAFKQLPAAALAFGKTLLAADEVSRPEALNLQNLQNAAKAFREDGVFKLGADGRVDCHTPSFDPLHEDLRFLLGLDEPDGQPGR